MDNLGNINQQIGESARWLRNYQSARQAGQDTSQYFGGQSSSSNTQTQDPMSAMMSMMMGNQAGLNPMYMIMYMQMMMGAMSNPGGLMGMNPGAQTGGGFPPYYLNIPDNMLQQFFAGQQAQVNPASSFLADQFKNADTQSDAAGKTQHFTDAEVAALQSKMEDGSFSVNQLGEALMKYIHRVPAQYVDEFTGLLGRLVKENVINPSPFVSEAYLSQLSPERQDSLSAALAKDALSFEDGSPNSYFAGHLLQQVNGDPDSQTRPFVRDLLARAYAANKADMTTPQGQQLTSLFNLADARIRNGLLEFPGLI